MLLIKLVPVLLNQCVFLTAKVAEDTQRAQSNVPKIFLSVLPVFAVISFQTWALPLQIVYSFISRIFLTASACISLAACSGVFARPITAWYPGRIASHTARNSDTTGISLPRLI